MYKHFVQTKEKSILDNLDTLLLRRSRAIILIWVPDICRKRLRRHIQVKRIRRARLSKTNKKTGQGHTQTWKNAKTRVLINSQEGRKNQSQRKKAHPESYPLPLASADPSQPSPPGLQHGHPGTYHRTWPAQRQPPSFHKLEWWS